MLSVASVTGIAQVIFKAEENADFRLLPTRVHTCSRIYTDRRQYLLRKKRTRIRK